MDFGFVEEMARAFMWVCIVAVFFISFIAFMVGRWTAPTAESQAREKARQEVIQQLTPEQRKALGL